MVGLGTLAWHRHSYGRQVILGLLTALARAFAGDDSNAVDGAAAAVAVPVDPDWVFSAAVAALAEQPLDPRTQLEFATALANDGRHHEAAGLRMAWLGASDPAVAMQARVSLARWLLQEAPQAALQPLLVELLRGPELPETPGLRARLAELGALPKARATGAEERARVGEEVRIALDSGHIPRALGAIRHAVVTAPTPLARALLLDDLASVLVVSAEARKRAGDIPDAVADYVVAVTLRPDAARVRGLAGLLWQSGNLEGAWALYQRALDLEPKDSGTLSATLAVGVEAGHAEEAWALVVRAEPPRPELGALRRAFERWRGIREAESAVRAGDFASAEAHFRTLAESWPADARIRRGLADALAGLARHEDARAEWREAARLEPLDPWAVLGEANALVKLGLPADARARLIDAFPPDAPAAAVEERRRVEARTWQTEAEQARASGDPRTALEAYRVALLSEPDPWVYVGIAFLYLDDGQPELALAFCDEAQVRFPEHTGAAEARVHALARLGRYDKALRALDYLEALELMALHLATADAATAGAAPNGVTPDAAAATRAVAYRQLRVTLVVQEAITRAREARERGLAREAAEMLATASRHAEDAESMLLVAEAWLEIGRPADARRLCQEVILDAPDHVGALLGLAGARIASGRLRLAENGLYAAFHRLGDPRLGLALAEVQTRRGDPGAAATLARVEALPAGVLGPSTSGLRPFGEAPLPALPLPSGRATPRAGVPRLAAEAPKTRLPRARLALAAERASRSSAGVLAIARGGLRGFSQLAAIGVPVEITSAPLGSVRVRAQVVPLYLVADTGTDDGMAATIGFLTPEARRVSGNVHIGTSPFGFDGPVYPTWHARLALRAMPRLGLAFETTRAPRSDSRASWAGEVYAPTGERYGRASELSVGASLGWTTDSNGLGIAGRAGWVEAIGVHPNPFGEGLIWAEQRASGARHGATVSASGIAQTYARRDDGFLPGQGAYFSPPLHVAGLVQLDWHVDAGPARVCAGLGGGPRYLGGEATAFAREGFGGVGNARLGAGVRVGRQLTLAVDGRGQIVSDGWRQVGALAVLSWGVPAAQADLRSSATLAAVGLALPSASDACRAP